MHVASWVLLIVAVVVFGVLTGLTDELFKRDSTKAIVVVFVPTFSLLTVGAICAVIAEAQVARGGGAVILLVYLVLAVFLGWVLSDWIKQSKSLPSPPTRRS